MESEKPQKENVYFFLINECHKVISSISEKTRIMQSEVDCIKEEKEPKSQSQLDYELQGLLAHLNELNGNFFI